jgi:hypothetical protein
VEHPHLADGNPITDKMKVDLHMLGLLVLHRVGGEVDHTDVVAVDKCAPEKRVMELS